MLRCKFKYGDKVIANGHEGKIVSITKDISNNKYRCTVKFDNQNLIPSKMSFDEERLEYAPEDQVKKTSTKKDKVKCNCGITATYGEIHASRHKDYCDLYKQHNGCFDLLKEFEAILNGDDEDDDDDFGFFSV